MESMLDYRENKYSMCTCENFVLLNEKDIELIRLYRIFVALHISWSKLKFLNKFLLLCIIKVVNINFLFCMKR